MSRRPAWAFRKPMAVTQLRWFRTDGTYPVCPQCGISLEREYQRFCDRCGQRLGWEDYERILSIYPPDYFENDRNKETGRETDAPARKGSSVLGKQGN